MVGTDNNGLVGARVLAGRDAQRRTTASAGSSRTRSARPVSVVETKRSSAGENLHLTLDARIQERTEAVLAEVGQTYTPQGATAVVMDPRTGEILALANWPRVDANNIDGAPAYARQNRAIQANYEPGSTFKAITVSGALEEHLVQPGTTLSVHADDHGGRPDRRRGARGRRRGQERGADPERVVERRRR